MACVCISLILSLPKVRQTIRRARAKYIVGKIAAAFVDKAIIRARLKLPLQKGIYQLVTDNILAELQHVFATGYAQELNVWGDWLGLKKLLEKRGGPVLHR